MYYFNFFRTQLWQHLISYNRFRNMNMCLLEVAMCEKCRSSHFQSARGVKSLRTGGRLSIGEVFCWGGEYPITCHELSQLSGVGIFTNMPLVLNWKLHLRYLTRLWACLKWSWFLFKSYPSYAHTPSDFGGGHFSISDFISYDYNISTSVMIFWT